MARIIIYLLIGLIIGYRGWIPKKYYHIPSKLTTGGLMALLFAMGTQLGGNAEVVNNLRVLGWQALLLALGAIFGSIFLVYLGELVQKRVVAYRRESGEVGQ